MVSLYYDKIGIIYQEELPLYNDTLTAKNVFFSLLAGNAPAQARGGICPWAGSAGGT
jgi:hypothetical protein